ncbi:MAG: glycyl radical protein, partial [Clostridia bacterium]|nr:glycyl radical protein [Clostridia bacterium]
RIMAGAQNISIQPKAFAGEEGLDKLAAIIGGYFDMGGLQVQLTAVDVNQLRDAQINPDAHRDLTVRITGYSAVFVDMVKRAQDDIIRREEMAE